MIIPEQESAARLAKGLSSANVMDYIDLSDEYGIAELPAPRAWCGRTLAELGVRSRYRVDILGVRRGEQMELSLGASYVFQEGDTLIALGKNEDLDALQGA